MENNICDIILEGLIGEDASYINDTLDGVEPSILRDAAEKVGNAIQEGGSVSLWEIWSTAMWTALERVFGEDYSWFIVGNKARTTYSVYIYENDVNNIEDFDGKVAEFEDLTDFRINTI